MRRASVAGPPGSIVRSPKNSTSTPVPLMSRSQTSATISAARSRWRSVVPAPAPRATMSRPTERRSSAIHSNSSGGSTGSTTAVTRWPSHASQAPPWSQPPRWGRARITPLPSALARSNWSTPVADIRASTQGPTVPGRRHDSIQ
ncbi:MAG: hypothetical protein CYG61_09500 [Actinobacteria bacterium]|nr:MAG: hypothetical protein CYG61_09500 [Actinomycetota bacterium]